MFDSSRRSLTGHHKTIAVGRAQQARYAAARAVVVLKWHADERRDRVRQLLGEIGVAKPWVT
jgi:HEPN domain-containing protein